jgi:uncharacterized membrane protein YbaN (DUF454 family)
MTASLGDNVATPESEQVGRRASKQGIGQPTWRTLLWRLLALISVLLGLIGVLIPGLPTVPFMILAAWAASKGWPRLEGWLVNHRHYGPHISRWRESGAIPRQAKIYATLMMILSVIILTITETPTWLLLGIISLMGLTLVWMWRRPD